MFPDLIENKIWWYQWRSSVKAVCLEYHQTFGLAYGGHFSEKWQKAFCSNLPIFKKKNSLVNWRCLVDENYDEHPIFSLAGEPRGYFTPKNY